MPSAICRSETATLNSSAKMLQCFIRYYLSEGSRHPQAELTTEVRGNTVCYLNSSANHSHFTASLWASLVCSICKSTDFILPCIELYGRGGHSSTSAACLQNLDVTEHPQSSKTDQQQGLTLTTQEMLKKQRRQQYITIQKHRRQK